MNFLEVLWKRKIFIYFIWGFLICTFDLIALDPAKSIGKYIMDHWGSGNGLPSDSVTSIAQTHEGYLWLGTSRGLVRFDGIKFEIIDCGIYSDNFSERTYHLFVDQGGSLWIAGNGKVVKLADDEIVKFSLPEEFLENKIICFHEDMNRNFWIITERGLLKQANRFKFEAMDSRPSPSGKSITSYLEDKRGNIILGTWEGELYQLRYGEFIRKTVEDQNDFGSIMSLYEDRSGSLWIGTYRGIIHNDGKSSHSFTTTEGLSDDRITTLLEDRDGNLWVGTINGLNLLKLISPGNWSIEKTLENNIITSLYEDLENNIWVGTNGSGLIQFREGLFYSFGLNEGLPNDYIISLYEDSHGDIWIGSAYGGLYRFRDNTLVENLMEDDNLEDLSRAVWIKAIVEDSRENLWISACGQGVFQKRGDQLIKYDKSDGLISDCVICIHYDSSDNLWMGTFYGLSILMDGNIISYTERDGLADNIVYDIYEDKDQNIWIATPQGINVLRNGEFSKDRIETYFNGTSFSTIYADRAGVFWLGTLNSGIVRFADGESTVISTKEGLATNVVYNLLEDERENLWLTSDSGIHRVNKSQLNDFSQGKIDSIYCASYDVSDGMGSIECSNRNNSVLKTQNGEFWFATKKGISILKPDKLKKIFLTPPSVVLEKMEVDGVIHKIDNQQKSFGNIDSLSFILTACSFSAPDRIKFKYKLEGNDLDWIVLDQGEQKKANYQDLRPGNYTFRVMAGYGGGVWNDQESQVSFTVRSRFSKTWMFKILLFLCFLITGGGGYIFLKRLRFAKAVNNKNYRLDPDKTEKCLKHLGYLLEVKKIYKDDTLSLSSLSEMLSIPAYQLSQIINVKLNKKFFELINSYRIEEAKKQLTDPEKSHLTILDIAYEVGFSSKVAFYNAFKKFTGETPLQLKKKNMN